MPEKQPTPDRSEFSVKIIHILPELEEGGVERHVLWLAGEQASRGYKVTVISSGGKMVPLLRDGVNHLTLPVDVKNPLTAFLTARKIAQFAKNEGIQLLHAHSRVPAWIAEWAAAKAKIPYIVTAHVVFGNKRPWIYRPYRKAAQVICVSEAVEQGMASCFSGNTKVILNGMPDVSLKWSAPGGPTIRFLFIGRLSPVKGIQDIIEILPSLKEDWTLDIVGDGPLYPSLLGRVQELGLGDRVFLRGFRDDTDDWLAQCSCLLFPSYTEGMPLTLARAVQMNVPALASHIPPVAEMALSGENLLPPGEKTVWKEAIQAFIDGRFALPRFAPDRIPTVTGMADQVEDVYLKVLGEDAIS